MGFADPLGDLGSGGRASQQAQTCLDPVGLGRPPAHPGPVEAPQTGVFVDEVGGRHFGDAAAVQGQHQQGSGRGPVQVQGPLNFGPGGVQAACGGGFQPAFAQPVRAGGVEQEPAPVAVDVQAQVGDGLGCSFGAGQWSETAA